MTKSILLAILFGMWGQGFGVDFSKVALFAHGKITGKVWQTVEFARACESPDRVIYGNKNYGYFYTQGAQKRKVEIVPLGFQWPLKFWCLGPGRKEFLGVRKFSSPLPKMMTQMISTDGKKDPDGKFYLAVGSFASLGRDFVTKEGYKNSGFLYLVNALGEPIWAYIPRQGRKPVSLQMHMTILSENTFLLASDEYWEVFNFRGELIRNRNLQSPVAYLRPSLKFYAVNQGGDATLAVSQDYQIREQVRDWFTAGHEVSSARLIKFAQAGRNITNINSRIPSLVRRSLQEGWLDQAEVSSLVPNFLKERKNRAAIIFRNLRFVFLLEETGVTKVQTKGTPLAVEFIEGSRDILVLESSSRSRSVNRYGKALGEYKIQNSSEMKASGRALVGSLDAIDGYTVLVFSPQSSMHQMGARNIPPDFWGAWDIDGQKWRWKREIHNEFYSQGTRILALNVLPGTSVYEGSIE